MGTSTVEFGPISTVVKELVAVRRDGNFA